LLLAVVGGRSHTAVTFRSAWYDLRRTAASYMTGTGISRLTVSKILIGCGDPSGGPDGYRRKQKSLAGMVKLKISEPENMGDRARPRPPSKKNPRGAPAPG
jgi:hypothetical protein